MYNTVNADVVAALRRIAGEGNVLIGPEAMEPYTHDEVVGLRAEPEVVVRVANAAQVSEVFKLAQRERVPVTPRGAGYGLSGGAVPAQGGGVRVQRHPVDSGLRCVEAVVGVGFGRRKIEGEEAISALRDQDLVVVVQV